MMYQKELRLEIIKDVRFADDQAMIASTETGLME